ncbi:MAG TPA: hypothetical protein VEK73_12615 [Xanthobacteraceae bacterium]|nr:hypothetical protein [Xanthobacteraceae bacterium]
MWSSRLFITAVVLLVWPDVAHPATLAPEEAASHVGESATVCGLVASATFAARSNGQPTFLNLGKPYPDQIFTAVIWGSDRSKFGSPETALKGKNVCVTGDIRLYRGRPEIILHDPKQLIEK